jgi:hypothetical protein
MIREILKLQFDRLIKFEDIPPLIWQPIAYNSMKSCPPSTTPCVPSQKIIRCLSS